MGRIGLLAAILLAVLPARAQAGAFGGFSEDGKHYLAGKNRVCAPLTVAADGTVSGAPVCAKVAPGDLPGYGFRKGKPGRRTAEGGVELKAIVDAGTLVVGGATADGARLELVRWLGTEVSSAGDLYPHAGGLIAVEYTTGGMRGKTADVVVFDVRQATVAASPAPASQPASGPASRPVPPSSAPSVAFGKATAGTGTWVQTMVPCDTAGVEMTLGKDGKARIRVETRCQGAKDVTKVAGAWVADGDVRVVITFDNDDGPSEAMPCEFASCPDESGQECLTCGDPEILFILRPKAP